MQLIKKLSSYFKRVKLGEPVALTPEEEELKQKALYKKQVGEEVDNILKTFSLHKPEVENLFEINKLEALGYVCTEEQKSQKKEFFENLYFRCSSEKLLSSFEEHLSVQDWVAMSCSLSFQLELQNNQFGAHSTVASIYENAYIRVKELEEVIARVVNAVAALKSARRNSGRDMSASEESLRLEDARSLEFYLDKAKRFPQLLSKLNDKEFARAVLNYIEPFVASQPDSMGQQYGSMVENLVRLIINTHHSASEAEELLFLNRLKDNNMIENFPSLKKRIQVLSEPGVRDLSLLEKAELAFSGHSMLIDFKNDKKFIIDSALEARIKEIERKKDKYIADSFLEERLRVKDIVEVSLKNAVSMYLQMDLELRDTQRNNEGKTGRDILEETLTSLEESLSEVHHSIHEKRLNLLKKENIILQRQLRAQR